jgi:hypothetical protein
MSGQAIFSATAAAHLTLPALHASSDVHDLREARCDAEGISRSAAPRNKLPQSTQQYGFFQLLLAASGALASGADHIHRGKRVRVINGADRLVNQLKAACGSEPPTIPAADITVCAGATDIGVPVSIVRHGHGSSIVRPGPVGEWLDTASARARLGI